MIGSVAILGAGAMGSLFAARIAETGARVTVIDVDADRLAAIAASGITLTDDRGTRTVRVAAALAGDVGAPVDLVVLFTKGMHSAAAIASVAHLRAHRPIALTLQNGIGNAELLAEGFGADRVVMGTALIPADLTGPCAVASHGFASIALGAMAPDADDKAGRVASLLRAAGFAVTERADIAAAVWEKVAFNAALNAIGMLCQVPNAGVDNPPGRRIAAAVARETVAVAAAQGIAIDAPGILASVDAALRDHRAHKASMLHDREAGRPSEIESINGAIAREGARLGVPTPVCETLSDLVRIVEAAVAR
ncbi:ketopantoate reductase family protein [Sphingomonas hengshuiensis]|uniref:2-dehydropantoate 2-reductase n=1 Tax=Sphingomonas hengshuiensis TaxID=1609977 RepID=A0A7U4JBM6_9SPHN|nr:2-dehydropantoate 2-reductase [Sphingomonas hengshuiensis]AJP73845.1 2-dehydropantoate 2-reductase [Sphingomonas hengshuiensis]